jgi:uncharacterized protein (TIGR00251 family)
MILKVKVHPNSDFQKIEKISEENYSIWLKSAPKNNSANIELLKLLKKYFKKEVEIKFGLKGRKKIVEVKD